MLHRLHCGLLVGTVMGVVAAAALSGAAGSVAPDEPATEIGVARVDITPESPIYLSGYAVRQAETTEVKQPLHARAMAIGADDAPLSVFITAEVIGIAEWMTEEVADRLGERVGLKREHLAINATHTHTGPSLRGVAPTLLRNLSDEQERRIDQYSDHLVDMLEQVALEAIADRQPAELTWGQGEVDFAVNRRKVVDGQWVGMVEQPDAPVDPDLPVLAARDAEGKLLGLVVNYACHCTTLAGIHNYIHGDWAGEAAQRLEQAHDSAVAMIAIGCGADANPAPRGALEYVDQHGQAIADEVARVLDGEMIALPSGPVADLQTVELPFEPTTRAELEGRLDDPAFGYSAQKMLDELGPEESPPSHLSYTIQTWEFGEALAMVFLPGEVVVDYAIRLKGELDGSRLWLNAYANASPSYIASSRVIAEGGYEVDDSMAYYHQPNRFKPVIEDIIVDAIRDTLESRYGRKWSDEQAELVGDNEPRLIEADDDGSLHLIAEAGIPYGPHIEYMPEQMWRAFGWWLDEAHVAWDLRVDEAGTYEVHKEWSVDEASANRPYVIEAGDQRLRDYVASTGQWENFETTKIGRIELEAGEQRITVKPAGRFDSGGLMDLRELRLVPVD